ncbi:MAG TPA: hypothetical protein HPP56_10465 [Nitrospirae bacterium]|nr:hypothetical protein [Nitrospirota bacterium]
MEEINPLRADLALKVSQFATDIKTLYDEKLHSFYITGSAITDDYNEKVSDINTLLILKEIQLSDLELLWNLGKKYRKKGISAPICMTPQYISDSIDVFPIEFHEFKLIHYCIYGEDLLSNLEINREHLRLQCEREIKTRLINLRQSFLSTLGEGKEITRLLNQSVNGTAPLFRAILRLANLPVPIKKPEVFTSMQGYMNYRSDLFANLLLLKEGRLKPSIQEGMRLFKDYYRAIERLGSLINSI